MKLRLTSALLICACSSAPPPPPPASPASAAGALAAPAGDIVSAKPPLARREELVETLHGKSVPDPYRWLEDAGSDEVKEWMAAQDEYARAVLRRLPGRDALAERLKALFYVDTRSAPKKRGARWFYSKKAADKEKSIYYWSEKDDGPNRLLLNPHTLSADGTVSVDQLVPSWDGKLVAYLEKGNNADEATLKVMKVDGGELLARDTIEHLRYTTPSWTPDNRGFFYTWIPSDPAIPPNERMGYGEIRYHRLGDNPAKDEVVREKTGDPTRWQSAWLSKDGKYLFLSISRGWAEQDIYVRFLKDKKPSWRPLAVGTKALYSVVAHKDVFYVATNDGAPRWKIYAVKPGQLDKRSWKLVVPEHASAVIDDVNVVGGHLALTYLENASTRLELRTLAGKVVRQVPLPAIGTASPLIGDPDEDVAFFSFSSFAHPDEIHRTNVKTGETKLFSKVSVPVNPSAFEVTQQRYPSKDKTEVTIFLVHKKGLEKNGEAMTLLYGYGGFNISLTPAFTPWVYPFLEAGGVFAVANLRGGGEYGEAWHQAGMLEKKQNVFDDFIAAAEWLVKEKYTRPERLAIRGGSNGGLLVGAAMTQRPELFSAVICLVPLLDMVRYHRYGIGKAWVPEYGSADDPAQLAYLLAYSPYHRVETGKPYPALLMLSADSDDRVDPFHARKFVAAVEAASASGRSNLLRIESNAGHGGADLRKQAVEQAADQIAFLLAELGRAGR